MCSLVCSWVAVVACGKEADSVKNDSFLGAISPYLIMVVIAVIGAKAGLTADACAALVFCIIFGAIAGGYIAATIYDRLDGKVKKFRYLFVPSFLIFTCLFFAAVVSFTDLEVFEPEPNKEHQYEDEDWDSVVGATEIAAYYQDYYPMVWGYIKKNADRPYDYIEYYHEVWGDLQAYTGDGINFDTLTRYEQSLVNYPAIGQWIYFATSKSIEYHSTNMCYTLLRSAPVFRPASQRYNYNPCSKCVGN